MRILVGAAVLPALLLLWLVYRMDKIEKEPLGLLGKLFFLGILSVIPAIILEKIVGAILNTFHGGDGMRAFLDAFFCVALVEELCKYLALRIGSWRSPHFDHRFDGLLYSVFVAMGFAAVENLLYILRIGLSVAPVRALFSVPGHLAFGVAMGIQYTNEKTAVLAGDRQKSGTSRLLAVLLPLLLHGFFDFCLMSGSWLLSVVFFLFAVALDVYSFFSVRRMSRSDTPNSAGFRGVL